MLLGAAHGGCGGVGGYVSYESGLSNDCIRIDIEATAAVSGGPRPPAVWGEGDRETARPSGEEGPRGGGAVPFWSPTPQCPVWRGVRRGSEPPLPPLPLAQRPVMYPPPPAPLKPPSPQMSRRSPLRAWGTVMK